MGATSVTGVGPGDSGKRLAYLSSDLPKLEFTKTTTNDQDLITGEIPEGEGGAEGCSCDFDTEWELVYSRATDEPDGAPVPTGVTFDRLYEWAFGVHLVAGSPAMTLSLNPVTTPDLTQVMNLRSGTSSIGIKWSPDGITYFDFSFDDEEVGFLSFGALLAPVVTNMVNNNATIQYDGAGTYGPAGDFVTQLTSGGNDGYFVIARRRIVVP